MRSIEDQKRQRAARLLRGGWSIRRVASEVGIAASTVQEIKKSDKTIGIVKERKPQG